MATRTEPSSRASSSIPSGEPAATDAREWNSEQLFGREQEIVIRHESYLYRLRRTKLGKLILTK